MGSADLEAALDVGVGDPGARSPALFDEPFPAGILDLLDGRLDQVPHHLGEGEPLGLGQAGDRPEQDGLEDGVDPRAGGGQGTPPGCSVTLLYHPFKTEAVKRRDPVFPHIQAKRAPGQTRGAE